MIYKPANKGYKKATIILSIVCFILFIICTLSIKANVTLKSQMLQVAEGVQTMQTEVQTGLGELQTTAEELAVNLANKTNELTIAEAQLTQKEQQIETLNVIVEVYRQQLFNIYEEYSKGNYNLIEILANSPSLEEELAKLTKKQANDTSTQNTDTTTNNDNNSNNNNNGNINNNSFEMPALGIETTTAQPTQNQNSSFSTPSNNNQPDTTQQTTVSVGDSSQVNNKYEVITID